MEDKRKYIAGKQHSICKMLQIQRGSSFLLKNIHSFQGGGGFFFTDYLLGGNIFRLKLKGSIFNSAAIPSQ